MRLLDVHLCLGRLHVACRAMTGSVGSIDEWPASGQLRQLSEARVRSARHSLQWNNEHGRSRVKCSNALGDKCMDDLFATDVYCP